MGFKDHFSGHAADYARFRPRYPEALFRYLSSIVHEREIAWDCGTGNGQAAVSLAGIFTRVVATDASQNQIANATQHAQVEYRVALAEESGLDTNSIDLVIVAQALHWFDRDRFYTEATRVLRPDGVIAAWVYNLLQVAPTIDDVVNRYYDDVVGEFWPPERKIVERFNQLPFPYREIATPSFEMAEQWSLEDLIGYLKTWSATQRFMATRQSNPLDEIEGDLRRAWGISTQTRRVVWPLTLRAGRRAT